MGDRVSFTVQFDNKNYDLKKFIQDHPGGINTLKHYEGKSVKNAMKKFGHSKSAYHILNDLKDDDELKDANLTGELSDNGRIITGDESTRDEQEIAFLEELEGRLDWSKPIFCQLDAIAPHYEKWVHSAVYRPCRLFGNTLMEAMTYTPWFLVPVFWVPVITYIFIKQYRENVLCGDSCTDDPLSSIQFMGHIVSGVLLWTALEYSLHRWVFHLDPGSSRFMMKVHFAIHGLHHKVPFDKHRQVFPPVPASLIAYILYILLSPLTSYPKVKAIGTLAGYLAYDMMHFYVHHGSPKDGTYLYAMKRYHSNHHFINHDKAYGISSKFWDVMFRTVASVKKLGFSLQW